MAESHPEIEVFWPLLQALAEVADLVHRQTAAHGQDPATVKLLGLLASGDHPRPTEIAARLGLSPAAVTRRVRTLSQAGDLEIRLDPGDSRSYTLALTDAGQAHLNSFAIDLSTRIAQAIPDWDRAQISQLTTLLSQFLAATHDLASPAPTRAPAPWWRRA